MIKNISMFLCYSLFMDKIFSITVNNLEETDILAMKFSNAIRKHGAFVCLYGDIGAGKTAFTKLVAKHLNVKEKVTSPSFVIINEYLSGDLPVYHFDLYRLEKEGVKTIIDELTEYTKPDVLTMVEWAEFSDCELPFDRIEIKIEYIDENTRKFDFYALGDEYKKALEGLKQ